MSMNLGKLALGVASLAFVGSIGFAVSKKDTVVKSTAAPVASGQAYAVPDASALPEASLGWIQNSKTQDNLWAHDLFTPVEVFWNAKSTEYQVKSEAAETNPAEVSKFGLRLVSLAHPKYRLRISNIAEAPSKVLADATIFFVDDEHRDRPKGKIGETVGAKGAQVKILKYEPRQTDAKTGVFLKGPTVTVRDLALRREITIGQAPVELTDKLAIVFCGEETTAPVWTASAIGEKFESEAGSFAIKGVDFEGQTVTVEKTVTTVALNSARKVITETLLPIPAAPKADPKK